MISDNNKKDKRFSRLLGSIERGKSRPDRAFLDELRDRSLEEFDRAATGEDRSTRESLSVRRKIMNSMITKIAAAAAVVIAAFIGFHHFMGGAGGGSVAFAEVLGYFQTYSYTFDLSVDTKPGNEASPVLRMKAMVWEYGKMRVDCQAGPAGKITSVTELTSGKSLLLFHQNRTAVMKEEPVLNPRTGAGGIVSFCMKPIENLWNLRDGSEKPLGQAEIDGQAVTGFEVYQTDAYFEYTIDIWADAESGVPARVETIAAPWDSAYPTMVWVMENFDLGIELNDNLFSLSVPAGYTLAYQETLETAEAEETRAAEPGPGESDKIVGMLEAWTEGRSDEAIALLLSVDWSKEMAFGQRPYFFGFTEKGYIALKAEDQQRVIQEVMATTATLKNIVKEAVERGKAAGAGQDYAGAAQYFEAAFRLGKLAAGNPEGMVIARLTGIAMEKAALTELVELYTAANDAAKLRAAQERLRAAQAEGEAIKRQAMGQ